MAFDAETMKQEQQRIAKRVSLDCVFASLSDITSVAAADISCNRDSNIGYAAVMLFTYPAIERVDQAGIAMEMQAPYVPGFLSFREGPLIEACLEGLKMKPDVLICDGQGYAHPRRAGLACHVGVKTGIPSIGCAKSPLIGTHETLPEEAGSWVDLIHNHEKVGEVVRTRSGVSPLYISPGHQIDFEMSTQIILSLCRGLRQPEPIRAAHRYVNQFRLSEK
ncbi:MAG: endonuclease V [Candidatus Hinthialibacter antarcticus]|nr:endonuclease V [Candidatus Hinthialibacter antarcticus]